MKFRLFVLILSIGLFILNSCDQTSKDATENAKENKTEKSADTDYSIPESINLSSENDTVSYCWGINVGSYLKNLGYTELNMFALGQSFNDLLNSKKMLFEEQEAQLIIKKHAEILKAKKDNPENNATENVTISNSTSLNNIFDTVSYCWGMNLATFFNKQGYDEINLSYLSKSLDDVLKSKELLIDAQTANLILQKSSEKMRQLKLDKNRKASEAFLAENKTKPGVTTLESGLQYKIIKQGTGTIPKINQKINAHYHGTLTDGTVFDSSVERGTPFSFTLGKGQVIKGWDEAFQLMPVGSKWIIYLPSDLAYGENPRPGGPIEPNMALIFEVELLSIEK